MQGPEPTCSEIRISLRTYTKALNATEEPCMVLWGRERLLLRGWLLLAWRARKALGVRSGACRVMRPYMWDDGDAASERGDRAQCVCWSA